LCALSCALICFLEFPFADIDFDLFSLFALICNCWPCVLFVPYSRFLFASRSTSSPFVFCLLWFVVSCSPWFPFVVVLCLWFTSFLSLSACWSWFLASLFDSSVISVDSHVFLVLSWHLLYLLLCSARTLTFPMFLLFS
jgi:hypothetical protein